MARGSDRGRGGERGREGALHRRVGGLREGGGGGKGGGVFLLSKGCDDLAEAATAAKKSTDAVIAL